MDALAVIVARNPDPAPEERRGREAAEFKKKMRDQAMLARGREGASRFMKGVTGRVIFPARWSAEVAFDRTYGRCVRCWTRWHGLRLVVRYFGPNDRGWPVALAVAEYNGESEKAGTQAELAAALRKWGLA